LQSFDGAYRSVSASPILDRGIQNSKQVSFCRQRERKRLSTINGYGSDRVSLGRSQYAIILLISGGDSHHSRRRHFKPVGESKLSALLQKKRAMPLKNHHFSHV
jgi:hypothetical protein